MKVYHNITDLDTVQSPHPNCTSKFKNNRECSFQCREALKMLHGRPHLVSSVGSFTERLLIRKRNILTRVCRLSLRSPPKRPQVSNPSSTLHGVSDSDFRISDTTGLLALVDSLARDHSLRPYFCQRFGIERDN
jgi:hypothetical protein